MERGESSVARMRLLVCQLRDRQFACVLTHPSCRDGAHPGYCSARRLAGDADASDLVSFGWILRASHSLRGEELESGIVNDTLSVAWGFQARGMTLRR